MLADFHNFSSSVHYTDALTPSEARLSREHCYSNLVADSERMALVAEASMRNTPGYCETFRTHSLTTIQA
jgi:hypothetical protein